MSRDGGNEGERQLGVDQPQGLMAVHVVISHRLCEIQVAV